MHQAIMMKTIYSGAEEIISWLGPEADHIDGLFSFIEEHENSCQYLHDPVEGCDQYVSSALLRAVLYLEQKP